MSPWRDGLWWVETSYLSAGFVVENGTVVRCAPILRRRLTYWKTVAIYQGHVKQACPVLE